MRGVTVLLTLVSTLGTSDIERGRGAWAYAKAKAAAVLTRPALAPAPAPVYYAAPPENCVGGT